MCCLCISVICLLVSSANLSGTSKSLDHSFIGLVTGWSVLVYNTHTHTLRIMFSSRCISQIGANLRANHDLRRVTFATSSTGNTKVSSLLLYRCLFVLGIFARIHNKTRYKQSNLDGEIHFSVCLYLCLVCFIMKSYLNSYHRQN